MNVYPFRPGDRLPGYWAVSRRWMEARSGSRAEWFWLRVRLALRAPRQWAVNHAERKSQGKGTN